MKSQIRISYCGYTEDMGDEAHAVVCVVLNGRRVLASLSELLEDKLASGPCSLPCPQCDWETHLKIAHDQGYGQENWRGFVLEEKERVLKRVIENYKQEQQISIATDYDNYHEHTRVSLIG